jgi:hypothetical protein
MNLPSGLIFYLDFKYGTAQAGKGGFNGKSLFGGTGSDLGSTDSAVNGLYGEGRFGYTSNQSSTDIGNSDLTITSASWADVNFDSSLSASVSDGTLAKISFAHGKDTAAGLTRPDLDGVRSFHISASDFATADAFFPAHSKAVGVNAIFFAKTAGLLFADDLTVKYSEAPVEANRGDFEDNTPGSPADIGIPEVDLELKSEAIVAKTRKLKAVWTPELAQDLNAYHSIDAEAELTSMLSEYISLEIDLEILDMLKANALTTEYWSVTLGEEYDSANSSWVAGSNSAAYTKNSWFQTLGAKLNKVSNKIHQLTLRGGANFVVASPDVCTILESIPGFTVSADKDATSFAAGVTTIGSIANRYTIYKNPYMTSNEILLGFKGSNFLETGAVYAPYVPLIMTPLVYDPTNFTPRRGVMTRYAKKMVRPEFYGKVYVKDLANL